MCKEKRKIWLIGIGMGTKELLTREAEEAVKSSDCIIGANRMIQMFRDMNKPCISEYKPERIREYIEKNRQYQTIAIVLSGDVGFYSGAKKLETVLQDSEKSSEYEIQRIPGISSVVYLAAALHTSWEDAVLLSMHGRHQNFIHTVLHNRKTILLLGEKECGKLIVEKTAYYGLSGLKIHIGKNFSYPEESIVTKWMQEVTEEDLTGLCVVMIENPYPETRVCRHIRDEEFLRGEVPMTKEEVRTICLAKLKLMEDAVLYDVGAGTGSIAVEAALQSGGIRVYAVEKNPKGVELIRQNSRKFRTDQVTVIEGTAPEVLENLEAPTHVFIGGSSGNLKEILSCVKRKNPDVRIVLTSISLDTMKEVMEAVEEKILREPEIVQITAAKSRKLGRHHMMTGQNPIYIISEEQV